MDRIFEAIEEWMRNLLTGMVSSNLTTMYTDVNEKTGQIAAQVGQTPQGWNGSIYSMIQNLSESVIVPIAGMIITFVLCYELISMLTEKNNMHDIDTWMFFKYFFIKPLLKKSLPVLYHKLRFFQARSNETERSMCIMERLNF